MTAMLGEWNLYRGKHTGEDAIQSQIAEMFQDI
jgi:hypothetical protein